MITRMKRIFRGAWVLLCAVSFIVALSSFGPGSDKKQEELLEVATKLSQLCPMMVDGLTRLDQVSLVGDTLRYDYTIILPADSLLSLSGMSLEEIAGKVKENTASQLNSNPLTVYYRENQVPLKYHYQDSEGQLLFEFYIQFDPSK